MEKVLIDALVLFNTFVVLAILYCIKRIIGMSIPIKVRIACKIKKEKFDKKGMYIIKSKKATSTDLVIFYLHGGSYIAGFGKEHWHSFNSICHDLNAVIIAPDYPQAPKNTYIDVFNMIEPLYLDIIKKVDKQKMIVMGDSAGGGMALALMEKIAKENKELLPNKIMLISPWLDVSLENPAIEEVIKKDKVLNKPLLKIAGEMYIGKNNENNALTSPVKGSLKDLKNITIFTGTYDILNPDVHVLEQKAKEENVDILIKQRDGAEHIWILRKYKGRYMAKEDYDEMIKILKD